MMNTNYIVFTSRHQIELSRFDELEERNIKLIIGANSILDWAAITSLSALDARLRHDGVEFLAILVPHIALRYEVRIRYYGALSTTTRRKFGWINKKNKEAPKQLTC